MDVSRPGSPINQLMNFRSSVVMEAALIEQTHRRMISLSFGNPELANVRERSKSAYLRLKAWVRSRYWGFDKSDLLQSAGWDSVCVFLAGDSAS
jgi:hypothetical protein